MTERRDKLGRIIPKFDRSAANKKGAETKKERHGEDFYPRIGSDGGRSRSERKRGYFGILKDQGKTEELKDLAHRGAVKSNQIQAERRKEHDSEEDERDEGGD